MSQEYYNLERTAEILKVTPGEVNRMREQNQLHAYRDGANWKFRREDVEDALASLVRQKKEMADIEDEDLLSLSAEDEELPTQLFQSIDLAENDLMLIDEAPQAEEEDSNEDAYSFVEEISSMAEEISSYTDSGHAEFDDPIFSGDSEASEDNEVTIQLIPPLEDRGSSLDLGRRSDSSLSLSGDSGLQLGEDDEVILGASSGLNLGSDSGIVLGTGSGLGLVDEEGNEFELEPGDDVLEIDEDSDILTLGGEADPEGPTELSEDHQLNVFSDNVTMSPENSLMSSFAEPDVEEQTDLAAQDGVNREDSLDDLGSSDIFDIDTDFQEEGGFGAFPGDVGADAATPAMTIDLTKPTQGGRGTSDEDTGFSDSDFASSQTQRAVRSGSSPFEPRYSGLTIGIGLIPCILFLSLAGMMMFELIRNMWSWNQENSLLTSPIMDMIAGMLGLR